MSGEVPWGGKEDAFGFAAGATAYKTEPTKPIGDIKESWESAKKRTRRHCPQCKAGILLTIRGQTKDTSASNATPEPMSFQRAWWRSPSTI